MIMKLQFKALLMISVWFFMTSCEKEDPNPAKPTFDLTTIYPYHGFEGETINIWGIGFDSIASGNIVKFNEVEAKVERATATNLTIQVPGKATNGKITVTVNGKTLESGGDFIVLHEAFVTSFSPNIIKADTIVTIIGGNFEPNFSETIVKFGDKEAKLESATPTMLKVIVPKELAETGTVSVTVNDRTAVSINEFTLDKDTDTDSD